MKRLYKMIMSKGEPVIMPEDLVRKIMDSEADKIEIDFNGSPAWINKAHVVSVFLAKQETEDQWKTQQENEAWNEARENDPPPISMNKIQELKEKAKQLAIDKSL